MRRRYLFLAVAAAVALAWGWEAMPPVESAPPARAPQADSAQPAAGPSLTADLKAPRRAIATASSDLFAVPKRPVVRVPAPPAIVESPKPPPLPYKYDGRGALQGKRFVFLARNGKSQLARAGDTVDGTYLVESVAGDRAVLRYLPLDVRQVLLYAGGEAPELAAAPSPSRPVELQIDMPAEVILGQEFVVTVVLPGRVHKANVEVVYDAEVLSMVGAGLPRPGGRAVVEVASGSTPRAQLRFKVLADTPASTDIAVQVNATDASGKRVPVWVPTAYTVSLVQPGA